jgi:hypothetical protein
VAYPHAPSQDDDARDVIRIFSLEPDPSERRNWEILTMLADPRPIGPGCEEGPAPADAEALARSIRSDPDFEATAPVVVTIGGTRALQMDVVLAPGARSCPWKDWNDPDISEMTPLLLKDAPFVDGPDRARLYLLDLPEGSAARVLALATITDEDSFETVLESAKPIVDSIEVHTP